MHSKLEYQTWENEHKTILPNLNKHRTIMTFSGGKDSSVILYLMQQASKNFEFEFETHAACFPHDVLIDEERETIDAYWKKKGVAIVWHELSESDDQLDEALNRGIDPCLICNRIKKNYLMTHFKSSIPDWSSLVIIMSYSLWDLVSSTIENILNVRYTTPEHSKGFKEKDYFERFMETSQRFYPYIKLNGGFSIFKPLIKYNDQEIKNFLSEKKIPVFSRQCKYHSFRPKRLFSGYFEKMDLHFDFGKVMGFAKNALNLPEMSYYQEVKMEEYLSKMI